MWGVYAFDGFGGMEAWISGLQSIGHIGRRRSLWDYSGSEDFDAVVVFGLRGKGQKILADYRAKGVPVVVVDYGYIKRTNHAHDWSTGHWQVSLNGLNRIPVFECPSDRFDALGVEIVERGGDPNGYTLICTQTVGDASHGMSERGIEEWVKEQLAIWKKPLLRPHPLEAELTYGAPLCQAKTLKEALSGAGRVVVANSNTGHEALLAGIPVTATMPAAYSELTGSLPSLEKRRQYFRRAAYGQWTWREMCQGLPQKFLLERSPELFGTSLTL